MNNSSVHMSTDPYIKDIEAGKFYSVTFGLCFAVLFCIGIMLNSVVLHTFRKVRSLHTTTNVLIIGCVVCDMFMLIIGYPFNIVAAFCGNWIFGDMLCTCYGFICTAIGITNVGILTAISIERYLVICYLPFGIKLSMFQSYLSLMACFGHGLLWAILPLSGVGRFVLEKNRASCGPDWTNTSPSVRSYNYAIFIVAFFLPVCIVGFCYLSIYRKVRSNRHLTVHVSDGLSEISRDHQYQVQMNREANVALSASLALVTFLAAWSPYASMSLYSMYRSVDDIPPWVTTIAPLMAKSACVWNPLVYVIRNKSFHQAVSTIVCTPVAHLRQTTRQTIVQVMHR